MDRVKTYIEGLDDTLDGGIPKGHVVLVSGSPGTMKTSVTFSILYHNVKAGSKGLYISRGQPRGPEGRDGGPRDEGPRRDGAVHPRRLEDPPRAQGRGDEQELARDPHEVHRAAGEGEPLRPCRDRQPRGPVLAHEDGEPEAGPVPLLRLPQIPRRDDVPGVGGPERGERTPGEVRRGLPRGRRAVPAALRDRRDG